MKTVSWYIHSFQMMIDNLVIITPDREYHHMSVGKALNDYGHLKVFTSVISFGSVILILDVESEVV